MAGRGSVDSGYGYRYCAMLLIRLCPQFDELTRTLFSFSHNHNQPTIERGVPLGGYVRLSDSRVKGTTCRAYSTFEDRLGHRRTKVV